MDDRAGGFVPLARALRAPSAEIEPPPPDDGPVEAERPDANGAPAALREVRVFRAALADALEAELSLLRRDLATAVLARELELAPADVHAIARRAVERAGIENVVTVRAHPSEVAELAALDVAVHGDPALRRGDVELDVRSGTIDVTLGARLAGVLAEFERR